MFQVAAHHSRNTVAARSGAATCSPRSSRARTEERDGFLGQLRLQESRNWPTDGRNAIPGPRPSLRREYLAVRTPTDAEARNPFFRMSDGCRVREDRGLRRVLYFDDSHGAFESKEAKEDSLHDSRTDRDPAVRSTHASTHPVRREDVVREEPLYCLIKAPSESTSVDVMHKATAGHLGARRVDDASLPSFNCDGGLSIREHDAHQYWGPLYSTSC